MRSSRTSRAARRLAVTVAASGTAVALLAPAAGATTSGTGSTSTATFTPSPTLTITASLASLGSVGLASGSLPLGQVQVIDSMDDGFDWTASVASTDCFPPTTGLPTTLNAANAIVPASALTLNPGTGPVSPTVTLTTGTAAPANPAAAGAFPAPSSAGTLASPTYGSARTLASTSSATLATDPLSVDGTYNLDPTLSLNLSGTTFTAIPYLYTCTLQYTITG
ncbi:MAG TPA: hypothetical protein VFP61_08550 [Acidimicrobiales bacterium]|nr:hypothetical protein [Acidimicrobiales bacterium]